MSTAAVTRDLIVTHTRALKLPGVARVFESVARQARDAHWPHEDYLYEVLSAELASRPESVIRQRLREARFPEVKTLDTFDFPAAEGISATQIHALARGEWVTAYCTAHRQRCDNRVPITRRYRSRCLGTRDIRVQLIAHKEDLVSGETTAREGVPEELRRWLTRTGIDRRNHPPEKTIKASSLEPAAHVGFRRDTCICPERQRKSDLRQYLWNAGHQVDGTHVKGDICVTALIHHGVSPVERHGHQRHHAGFSNARTFSGKRLQGGIDKIDPAYYPVSPMAMGTTARREAAVDVGGTRGLPQGAAIVLRLLNPSR